MALPLAGGGVDQLRPAFTDFDQAVSHLLALKRRWAHEVVAHKKARPK